MRKLIFIIGLFSNSNAFASGDPMVALVGMISIILWIIVILLLFFLKSVKKIKIILWINIAIELMAYIFLVTLPRNYHTYFIGLLIVGIPFFCGLVNICALMIYKKLHISNKSID